MQLTHELKEMFMREFIKNLFREDKQCECCNKKVLEVLGGQGEILIGIKCPRCKKVVEIVCKR